MGNTDVKKETWDFLSVIKTGHLGAIAGNPAHANMSQKKDFVCNVHADISDYKKIAFSDKETETLLQNCTTKIVFGDTGDGKKTAIRPGLGVVLPSRILDIEQVTEITYDPHKED